MNECPHCGTSPCLPLARRLWLGPGGSARCRICGLKVAADVRQSLLAMMPPIVLFIATMLLAAFAGVLPNALVVVGVSLALFVLSVIVMFVLRARWVALRVDELSNAQIVAESRARMTAPMQARTSARTRA